MRISITGMLRNSAEELQTEADRRKRVRKDHGDDDCDCEVCSGADWSGFYAVGLEQCAEHLGLLDKEPGKLLLEFAELYALDGLAEFARSLPSKDVTGGGHNSR